LAGEISDVLFTSGSYEDSVNFATKSYNILMKKSVDLSEISNQQRIIKILDNKLLISKSLERMDKNDIALQNCEESFNLLDTPGTWDTTLGMYLVEILVTTFLILKKDLPNTYQYNLLYILDLIDHALKDKIPIFDDDYYEGLMRICEKNKNCTCMVTRIMENIKKNSEEFEVTRLVNTTFEEFKSLIKPEKRELIIEILELLTVMYYCLGKQYIEEQMRI